MNNTKESLTQELPNCPFCGSRAATPILIDGRLVTTCDDESDKCQVGHRNFTIEEWTTREPKPVSVSLHALAGWLHGRYSGEQRHYEKLDSRERKKWRKDAWVIANVYTGGNHVD